MCCSGKTGSREPFVSRHEWKMRGHMRKAWVFVAIVLMTGIAGARQQENGNTMVMRARVPLESKDVKGAPYSAEIANDHSQILADGNRIVEHSTGRVYRDKDGRVRREEDRAGGGFNISIVDPVAGVSYSLDADQRVALKTPTPSIMMKIAEMKAQTGGGGRGVQRGGGPGGATFEIAGGRMEVRRRGGMSEQRNDEQLASRTIEGVLAQGHRTTTTIPMGAIGNDLPIVITSEEWTSPELQVLLLTERKDPRSGDSSYRLININRAEPDPSLFQVPSDYTVKETGVRRFEKQ
jgi:hypothetical protein